MVLYGKDVLEFTKLWKFQRHCGNLTNFGISYTSGKQIVGNKTYGEIQFANTQPKMET